MLPFVLPQRIHTSTLGSMSPTLGIYLLQLNQPCRRHGFRHVVDINHRLVGILKRAGTDKAVDMDELLKREALDVIGLPQRFCMPYKVPS